MTYTPRTFTFPAIEGISPAQLSLHIGLYEGYVKHVNLLTDELAALAKEGAHTYVQTELARRLGFEWNGMRLHELYFEAIEHSAPLPKDSALFHALEKKFGSYESWLATFSAFSARGPGWALLTYDPKGDHFFHTWVTDHEVGQLATLPILIALDHWEHAYLIDRTPSEKALYVSSYLAAQDGECIARRFDCARANA